jgi:hypothetical protein
LAIAGRDIIAQIGAGAGAGQDLGFKKPRATAELARKRLTDRLVVDVSPVTSERGGHVSVQKLTSYRAVRNHLLVRP